MKEELAFRMSLACASVARSPVVRSSVVQSPVVPNPVSYWPPVVDDVRGPLVEFRMLGRQLVSHHLVSNEWSAWCKPSIRPPVLSRSSSLDFGFPSAGNALGSVSVGEDDGLHVDRLQYPGLEYLMKPQFDDVLVLSYGYPGDGRQLLPLRTPLYNKFAGVVPIGG